VGLPQGHEALVGFKPDLSIPFIGLLLWAGCGYMSNSVADVTRTCVCKCWGWCFCTVLGRFLWYDWCTTSVWCFLIGLFGPFWRSFTNVRVTFTRHPILEFALVVRMIGVRTSLYAIGTLALVLGVNGCCRSRIFFSRTFAFGIARSFVAIFSFPLLCGRCLRARFSFR